MADEAATTRTFTDTRGRVWLVELHPANMKRVRELTGFKLGAVLDDELKGLRELYADPILFADVLYLLCKDEADARRVSDEEFGKGLGGGVLERAADAFWGALVDFSRSQVRKPLLALAEKQNQYEAKVSALAAQKIEALDVDALVRELTSSASAGSSAASSASTPPG